MNMGGPDLSPSGGGGVKRRRDEEGEEPKAKKVKLDIGGMVHDFQALAHLRELLLQNHPELADLVHTLGAHASELTHEQKSELLQDVRLFKGGIQKGSIQGERAEKRAALRELNELEAALKPSKKRAREEEAEEAAEEEKEEGLPAAKRARSDPLKELHGAVEGYLQGTH